MAARERIIGAGADLADGGPGIRFAVDRDGRVAQAFAIRHHGVVHAYVNACAHQEVELDWVPGAFLTADGSHIVCSLHGALYEPDTGHCIAGPCRGAALVKLPVREREDGALVCAEARLTPPSE